MLRRIGFLVLAGLLLAGCGSLAKKFVREPKEEKTTVRAPSEEYSVDPKVVYERHFVFAKVWMDEFKSAMDSDSRKRLKKSVEQAVYNLEILADYLPSDYEEEKKQIQEYANRLRTIYKEVLKLKEAKLPVTRAKKKVDQIRREFHNRFLPSKQPPELWDRLRVE